MRTAVRLPLIVLAWWALALSCQAATNVRGSGALATEKRSLPEFERVQLSCSGDVDIRQGEAHLVEITTDDNVLPLIETEVRGDALRIAVARGVRDVTSLDVRVTMPVVRGLSVSGAGDVRGSQRIIADDLDLSVSGAGSIRLDFTARNVHTTISGAGDIVLSGDCDSHTVVVSGAGDVNAFGLVAKRADATISGAGDCEIRVLEELRAAVSGAGDIRYKGDPLVKQRVSGAGSVRAAGE